MDCHYEVCINATIVSVIYFVGYIHPVIPCKWERLDYIISLLGFSRQGERLDYIIGQE